MKTEQEIQDIHDAAWEQLTQLKYDKAEQLAYYVTSQYRYSLIDALVAYIVDRDDAELRGVLSEAAQDMELESE